MTAEELNPAQAYQEYFGPSIFGPLSEVVVDKADPRPGERVLDVASGTGILTRGVARRVGTGGSVVGMDVNPAMVAVARDLAPPGGAAPIEWRVGDGTSLGLPDADFDLVVCQQGLQFFPDRYAGTREMRRVLRPGGRAVVATWQGLERHPLYEAMADAEEPHLKELGVEVTRAELEAPFSMEAASLRASLDAAGFAEVELSEATIEARFADADRFVERMEFAYAAVVPAFIEDPAAFRRYLENIGRDTKDVVDRYREGDEIVIPMHTNIAVAGV